jgi:hypothetical protein
MVRSHLGFHDVLGRSWLRLLILLAIAVFCASPAYSSTDELERGYSDMYNLDFVAAHNSFQIWMTQHPEAPIGPVSDAAAYLFAEFDRLGVLDIELFSDDDRFLNRARPTPNPAMHKLFDERTQQAELLAVKGLAKNPNDAELLYARALLCGLRSDYAALIDKRNLTALGWTKQASKYAGEALRIKPDLYDAHLATGVENYMLSLKPAPVRWFIGLSGGSSDKQLGISELKITAEHGHYLAPFARLMLAVAELREGNKASAKNLLAGLAQQFPNNTLYSRQMRRIGN